MNGSKNQIVKFLAVCLLCIAAATLIALFVQFLAG